MSSRRRNGGLNFERFGKLMLQARADLSIRAYLEGGPIAIATWFRAEKGMEPSTANFIAICDWMGLEPGAAIRHIRSGA